MTDKEWNESVLDTLTSDGWKLLEEKYKEQVETLKENLVRNDSTQSADITRGRIHEIRFLLSYRTLVENTLDEL